jgi:hypothetical protein
VLAVCIAAVPGPATAEPDATGAPMATRCAALPELEAQGYRVGSIRIRTLPIFEPGADGKLSAPYRLANDLHRDTR